MRFDRVVFFGAFARPFRRLGELLQAPGERELFGPSAGERPATCLELGLGSLRLARAFLVGTFERRDTGIRQRSPGMTLGQVGYPQRPGRSRLVDEHAGPLRAGRFQGFPGAFERGSPLLTPALRGAQGERRLLDLLRTHAQERKKRVVVVRHGRAA